LFLDRFRLFFSLFRIVSGRLPFFSRLQDLILYFCGFSPCKSPVFFLCAKIRVIASEAKQSPPLAQAAEIASSPSAPRDDAAIRAARCRRYLAARGFSIVILPRAAFLPPALLN
jgi:hypothetical protein